MPGQGLSYLFTQYLSGSITATEKRELFHCISQSENDEELRQLMDSLWQQQIPRYKMNAEKAASIFDAILNKEQASVRRMFQWKKWVAAASIILLFGLGYLIWRPFGAGKTDQPVAQAERFKNDVPAGQFKAKLTLADGSTIVLDSAAQGELIKQGGTVVINQDGKLIYTGKGSGEVIYNTLTTARGESYATILADGSKVWLNSASSIKFPVAFTGADRKVEITGEAYFEIAKDRSKPFKVNIAGRGEVEVLGTHFNISAYDNEDAIKTTLLEGSVKVNNSVILKPGQQAVAGASILVNNNADIEKIVAWKDNVFMFSGDDIQTVMRQVARWYDVDVEFKGQITDRHFTGIISRNNKVSEVLKMLQGTEKIKFEISGKRIVVSK